MFRIAGITSKGFEVLAEALSGKTLSFTRMEYGSGILPGLENIVADSETLEKYKEFIKENPEPTEQQILEMLRTEATDLETKTLILEVESLVSKKGDIGLYEAVSDNGITTLTGKVVDSSVSVDFRARELGVYAQVEEGEEVLFAYFSAVDFLSGEIRDSSDFISIPALLGQEQIIKVNIATGQAANITMKYNLNIYATKKEFDETVAQIRNQIAIEVSNIIAEAPESFDTLKEISDWITEHVESAAEMNSRINSNKSDIDKIKNKLSGIEESGNTSIYKTMFDLVRPIGDTYVQYPQQASPNELWGDISTWEVVNYDGAFFRASGGNAAAFIEKSGVLSKQGQSIQSHNHGIAHKHSRGTMEITGTLSGTKDIYNGASGAFAISYDQGSRPRWEDDTQGTYANCNFAASRGWTGETSEPTNGCSENTGGTETRPSNYTVRIWKRTA